MAREAWPNEVNSLGINLGFVEFRSIERIYFETSNLSANQILCFVYIHTRLLASLAPCLSVSFLSDKKQKNIVISSETLTSKSYLRITWEFQIRKKS